MSFPPLYTIGSIGATRPVFMIVMGIALVIFTWRLARGAKNWPARLMVAGSLMLGLGYAVIVPGYESDLIPQIARPWPHDPATALGWHALRSVTMNLGWLTFGLGIAMHAGLLPVFTVKKSPLKAAAASTSRTSSNHEPVA